MESTFADRDEVVSYSDAEIRRLKKALAAEEAELAEGETEESDDMSTHKTFAKIADLITTTDGECPPGYIEVTTTLLEPGLLNLVQSLGKQLAERDAELAASHIATETNFNLYRAGADRIAVLEASAEYHKDMAAKWQAEAEADLARIATLEDELAEVKEDRYAVTRQRTEALHRLDEYIALDAGMGATVLQLRARIAVLEAALREIADFAEQFIGDDEDGDERMYKVHVIADNALAPQEPP